MARHRRHADPARTPRALVPLGLAAVAGLGAAAPATAAPVAVPSTPPCDTTADVCVDLGANRAWLTEDGRATSAPMRITAGSAQDPTPTGTFAVQRKERHHVSQEIEGAPMPYAVFFDDEGRAFHGGDTAGTSHGCIHLERDDAQDVFAALEPGDEVEIVR